MKILFSLMIFGAILTGCSEPGEGPPPNAVSFNDWQQAVEQYVLDVGNGDANVLRDTTIWSSQKGFSLIGEPSIEKSTDAIGLLLGHRTIDDRPWFIYLVALIKRNALQDIRLFGLCYDADHPQWCDGETSDISGYQKHQAVSSDIPTPLFPRPDDLFDMTIDGNDVQVRHRGSGAIWKMRVTKSDLATEDSSRSAP
jgi:hypothetical protein